MIEINNTTRTKIDNALISRIAEAVLVLHKKNKKNLSIAFVGDAVMRRLNRESRGYDKTTDILAFEDDGAELGELIICLAQIKRQALKYSKSVRQELIFILVHGILHLLGHRDDTEKGRLAMIKLGEEVIIKIKNKI